MNFTKITKKTFGVLFAVLMLILTYSSLHQYADEFIQIFHYNNDSNVTASRIFAGPEQYPPNNFLAYGILAFPSRASENDKARHMMFCDAYIAALPHSSELFNVPISKQMVTIWPIQANSIADKLNKMSRSKVCSLAVEKYDLVTSLQAIKDAEVSGYILKGEGPFLLAWSPAKNKGNADTPVLITDLSDIYSPEDAKQILSYWAKDIEDNPDLWNNGFNMEKVRVSLRHWADTFGPKIISGFMGKIYK